MLTVVGSKQQAVMVPAKRQIEDAYLPLNWCKNHHPNCEQNDGERGKMLLYLYSMVKIAWMKATFYILASTLKPQPKI